jgi:hypothetical protein
VPMSCLLVAALMLLQYPYPGRAPRTQSSPNFSQNANTDAVATFTGTFKSADKKYLFIDTDDGNTMRMYITGATRFIRDDKPVKASDFHAGDNVTVDVSRDTRFNLLAVRIEAVPPKAEKKAPAAE